MLLIKIILLSLCGLYVESCRSSPPPPPPVELKPLPAPKIVNTTMEYSYKFIVTWEGVPEDQVQKEYPIKGYNKKNGGSICKAELRFQPGRVNFSPEKFTHFIYLQKVSLWVDDRVRYRATPIGVRGPEYEYPMRIVASIPETEPVSVTVGPDVRTANFTVEPQVAYQVRVQAFTVKAKGPYSFPETFKLLKSEEIH